MSNYSQLNAQQTTAPAPAVTTCAAHDFGSNQGVADQMASADLQGGAVDAFSWSSEFFGDEMEEAGFAEDGGALAWSGQVEADADEGQPFDASGEASWRKDGAGAKGDVGWTTDTESEGLAVQTAMKLSGGASVTVSTKRLRSDDPCEANVAVTVNVDLAAGVEGKMGFSKDDTSAGMGGHMKGEGHWSATKVLAEHEVLGLVSSVENGNEELLLGTFGQLKAVLDVGPEAVNEDYSGMKAGEARSYSGTVDAMMCLSLAHAGVGGEVRGQLVGDRSFSVVALSDTEREVRVAFRTSSTAALKGGVPLGVLVLGAGASQTEELGFETSGVLRLPEDAALLAMLEDVDTAADLELLQGEYCAKLPNYRHLHGNASTSEVSVGAGVLGVSWGHENNRRDNVGVEGGEVVGTIEGGAGSSISGSATGASAGRATSTALEAEVAGSDSEAQLTTKEEADWSLSAMVSWVTGTGEKGSVELAMADQRSRLTSTSLGDGDLDTLLDGRAQNPVLWNACCGHPDGHGAWVTTGLRIRAPQLDETLAAQDPVGARRVAQIQALADFVAGQSDAVVATTLDTALNRWGANVLGAELGEALGTRSDWPAGTEEVKGEWDVVVAQFDALDACEAAAVGAGDASIFETIAWMVWDDLGLLSEAVASLDISDTGFVASKLTEVAVLRTSVVERIRAVQLLTGAETCVGADGSVGADAVDVNTVELEGLMDAVKGFKEQEGVVFGRVEAMRPGIEAMEAAQDLFVALYLSWAGVQKRANKVVGIAGFAEDQRCIEPDAERYTRAFLGLATGHEVVARDAAASFVSRYLSLWGN